MASVDQLLIYNQAENPVYLVLEDGKAALHDAKEIWGKTVSETHRWLRYREGKSISTAIIGPAGESKGAAACIMFDNGRAAGRCALGAVMGSKRLKAVVAKGEGSLQVSDGDGFAQIVEHVRATIMRSKVLQRTKEQGTIQASPVQVEPICNFQRSWCNEEEHRALNAEQFQPFLVRRYGCAGCPVACGGVYETTTKARSTGLHANSISDFGTRLGIWDPETVIEAHGLCNDLGLDIDNASGAIAWAMEAFQRGLLTVKDTGGLVLKWGNAKAVLALIDQMAYRRAFGAVLSDGCREAATELGKGSEAFCITIKGQELMEALRPCKGWALGVIVSERGGTHTRGAPTIELSGAIPAQIAANAGLPAVELRADSYEGKEKIVAYYERLHAVLDSLGVCYFISDWVEPGLPTLREYSQALSVACGLDIGQEALSASGERIHTLGRLLNIGYCGFTRSEDYPPARLMKEQTEFGHVLEKASWDQLLDRYYKEHMWDPRTGWPTRRLLKELGLAQYAWILDRGQNTA
jgi:aldehyde:ferredoxin oxidoreductase